MILDGQHKISAALQLKDELVKAGRTIPDFLLRVRCLVVRQDTDVGTRQQIAGLQQARSANVKQQSLADRCAMFLREAEAAGPAAQKVSLLKAVYVKSGCIRETDGTEVYPCVPLP